MTDFTKLKNYIETLNDNYPLASSDIIVMQNFPCDERIQIHGKANSA